MSNVVLVLGAGSLLLSAAAYLGIARILARRRAATRSAALGQHAFVAWWIATALVLGSFGLLDLLAVLGVSFVPAYEAVLELSILGMSLSAAALGGHLVAIFSGRPRLPAMAAIFLAYFVAYTAALFYADPVSAGAVDGQLRIEMGRELPWATILAILATFYAPCAVAAFAYAGLLLHEEDRTMRFRLAMLAWSVLLVSVSTMLMTLAAGLRRADLQLGFHLLALATPLAMLVAYAPPRWVQRRWGVKPLAPQ